MADRTPMSDDDLMSICRKEEQGAQNYQDSEFSAIREKAQNYYDRQPYGDEQDGSSKVVTSEFQDVIESLMPGLMDVFCGTDNPVQFTAQRLGEEKWEDEANDYVPHVLMKQNEGFIVISALLKDALMFRLSGATVDLEDAQETRVVPVEGITQEAIDQLIAMAEDQPGAELDMELVADAADPMAEIAAPAEPTMMADGFDMAPAVATPSPTFSGTITITRKYQKTIVDSIAPEDILYTPSARDQDKASFLGFRKKTTSSDLVQMLVDKGVSEKDALATIDDLRSDRPISPEEAQRNDSAIVNEQERNTVGDSERTLWVVVGYVRADVNGDGISEMTRVVYAHSGGEGGVFIDKTEWKEEAAVVLATPILMPHVIAGRSIFDQTEDLQLIGSTLMRNFLDNQYLSNHPRPVVTDQVNLDSLLDWTPGSPVRLKAGAKLGESHVDWLKVPNIGGDVLAAMEYMATVRENRTGVGRVTQGLEGQTLQNKTLGGLDRMMGAAQRRQDLIAQTFAQTSIKRLYMLIYRAIKRAATGPISYRVGKGMFATVDPTQWPDDMSVSVDEGTGTGGKEAAVAKLGMVAQSQEKLIALQDGKAEGPWVTAENVANTAQALAEKLGFKTPGRFFQDPSKVAQHVAQPDAPPPPSPELLAAQAQIEILREAAAADIQVKREKAAADAQIAREKAQSDIAIAEYKAMQWAQIEREKAGLKAQLDDREMQRKADLKGMEIAADAHVEATRAAHQPNPEPNGSMVQ